MVGACVLALPLPLCALAADVDVYPSAAVHWLTVADGLPNLRVEALTRDRHGYVWIGTQGGLVRHEGLELSVLRRDPDRDDSLPGNNVLALMAAADGSIWAALSGHGVVRIDDTRVVRHWRPVARGGDLRGNYVWSMVEDCGGAVWGVYATDGLVRFDPTGGTPDHVAPARSGLPDSGFGVQLAVDPSCRLWLLRTDGLWRVDTRAPYAVRRVLDAAETEVPMFLSMAVNEDGSAFIGGRRGLLHVELTADAVELLRFQRVRVPVGVIRHASGGALWIGSRRGLLLFDPRTGRREAFPTGGRNALAETLVSDVLPGPEGEVWVATGGAGVARLPPGWRGFRRYPLTDGQRLPAQVTATDARDGLIWAGTADSRVALLDPESGETRILESQLRLSGPIIDVHASDDALWLLRRTSLVRRDRTSGEEMAVIRQAADVAPKLKFLEPAGRDRFWLADEFGRLRLIGIDGDALDSWHEGAGDGRELAEQDLVDIRRGPSGRWWLAGSGTLLRQDGAGAFTPVHRSEDGEITTLAFDGDLLWLASESVLERFRIAPGGLERLDRFTAGDGLPPGRIQGLVPDASGLWLLTSVGLARLEGSDGRFRLFSAGEGLGHPFNADTLLELPDGRFAGGSPRGLLLVDPDAISPASRPPPVHVTAIRAGERVFPIRPGDAAGPRLDWRQNSLEFRFRALSYIDPAQNRYRVRLVGWDDSWQEFIGRASRFYSRLPAGRYRFEVQAANADGVWNRDGAAVDLEIAAPPWRSDAAWAAYALIALVSTGLGWRSLRVRRRRDATIRRMQAQEQMADRQRALLARLNLSLEPGRLAERIAESAAELSATAPVHVALVHPGLPRLSRSAPTATEAVEWASIDDVGSDARAGTVLELGDPLDPLARVWLPALDGTARRAVQARLDLFAQSAGQVLENARLFVEVRDLARQAKQASEAKSDFLATMSHEIRTPLHGLLGMLALLDRAELDSDGVETVRTMRSASRQLERILDDVLDLSRIEAGRVDLEPRPFELPALLERVIELHASNAATGGLELRLRIDSDLPVMAIGDADRIAQILGNLVSNAIKFTSTGGVTVAAWLDGAGALCLAVSDTGPGIEASLRRELFEPFTRLDASRTRRHSGTGLGLAICRRLVEAMGGGIDLVSRTGRGSRFTVRLPLAGLAPQPPMRSALLAGMRLATELEAEDHRVVQRLARRWSIEAVRLAGAPSRFDALLYREELIEPVAVEGLRDSGIACWHVGETDAERAGPFESLRRPLTEARLVGALMEFSLSRSRKR